MVRIPFVRKRCLVGTCFSPLYTFDQCFSKQVFDIFRIQPFHKYLFMKLVLWSLCRRKALHQYDPPDLAMAFAAESEQRPPKLLKPRSNVAKESPTSIADRSEEWLSWGESPSREEQWGEEVLNDSDDELL
jgi:hypothetical protein